MKSIFSPTLAQMLNKLSARHFLSVALSVVVLLSMVILPHSVQAGIVGWELKKPGPGGTSILVLAVDPQNPSTLYAGTESGIYKSTDGGNSWLDSTNNLLTYYGDIPSVTALVIHPTSSNTIYLGSNSGGVFKSIDGGRSWTPCNNGITTLFIATVVIDPNNPAVLYAGTLGHDGEGGIFKSSDNGQTWTTLNMGLPMSVFVYSIVIDPENTNIIYADLYGDGIYKSINGGQTWTAYNTGEFIRFGRVLVMDPNVPTTMYLGTANMGMFKSVNGGKTFTQINQGISSKLSIMAVWVADSSTIYAGTEDGGIYKSINGGETWVYSSVGIKSAFIQAFTGIDNNPSVVYTGTSAGVFKTLDSGISWVDQNAGLPAAKTEVLLLLPQRPNTLYAGTSGGGVYLFQDQQWKSSSSGIANTWIRSLAYDPVTPTTLYAGTFFGHLYKSLDGGVTWSDQSAGLPTMGGDIRAIVVNPKTPTTVYTALQASHSGMYDSGVYKSLDGGKNWVKTSEGMPYTYEDVLSLAIDVNNPETLYAGVIGYGIYKTTDDGKTWKASSNGLESSYPRTLIVDPNQSSIVYAGIEGKLYRSNDSGATWQPTDLMRTVTSIVFNPAMKDVLYAGTEGGGVYKSIDNGISWQMMTRGNPNNGIIIYDLALDVDNQILYAAAMNNTDLMPQGISGTLSNPSETAVWEPGVLTESNTGLHSVYGIYALCVSEECQHGTYGYVFLPMIVSEAVVSN